MALHQFGEGVLRMVARKLPGAKSRSVAVIFMNYIAAAAQNPTKLSGVAAQATLLLAFCRATWKRHDATFPWFFHLDFIPAACADSAVRGRGTAQILSRRLFWKTTWRICRVGSVAKNLAEEIRSAQNALATTNKIAGTILDLRFAGGDDLDSAKAAADLFAQKKLPLAILINGETRGAAMALATALREARDGLVFGGAAADLKPDIVVAVKIVDEKKFLENPYAALALDETNAGAVTNESLSTFIDHTSEADLVREKIKDGEQDEDSMPSRPTEPQKPFIHDPVLARAVDLIKALAVVRQSHA